MAKLLFVSSLVWIGIAPVVAATSPAPYTVQPLAPRVERPAGAKPFQRLSPAESGLTVPNVYNDPRMWGDRFRELTLGALETGIAVADFNRDGRPDIYSVSKNGPCALYQQTTQGQFYDIAAVAGVAAPEPAGKTGATAVDINQDGWTDLYVCRFDAPNLLFVNNGDGTFTERAKEHGLDLKDSSVHASFADYDRDGDLDCYLVTNILDFTKSPQGRRNFLLRNDGRGVFADASKDAGVWGLTQGHSATWFDANADGWPDVYVANDFETSDRFYLNKGNGSFADVVDERLPHVTYFSMGADAGDLNNDGRMDFLVADMRDRTRAGFMTGMEEIGRGLWELERVTELIPQYMWNAVYVNSGTDRYLEVARLTGMEATGWTWAARLGDLDNDGRLDAFYTAGMIRNFVDADIVDKQNVAPTLAARAGVWKNSGERRESTLAYRNLGDLKFENVSEAWGLDETTIGFGCALADMDNDGDLDLVYATCNAPPTIVRNDTTAGHRVLFQLAGRAPNRDALGAELRLESSAGTQVRQIFTERGIVASEPATVHFGLGGDTTIKRLTVRWPRGLEQVFENLPADQLITIAEPPPADGAPVAVTPAVLRTPANANAWFVEGAAKRGVNHANALRPFDEFTRQRLLPRRLNGLGPALAAADVNGDGRADLFVSGPAGQNGALFLAQADGSFLPAAEQPWSAAIESDDVGAAFVDVNGDQRPDLVVAAGGVVHAAGDAHLNDRVYLNRGDGRFTAAPEGTLPADGESTAAIAAGDFDGDGKQDLFIGGRVVAGKYPTAPRSFLYRNTGGKFVDVTDSVAPALRTLGMVTAASWTDVDGDKRPDLVVALEWGPVAYFRNTGGKLEDLTAKSGLGAVTGWWSALAPVDVNGDGRIDLVAGNVGLNTKYRASAAEPTVLLYGDFDGSGKSFNVEAQTEGTKEFPLRGRSKLAYAFPWLAKKFPTYRAFSQASLAEIFPADKLAAVQRFSANELASGVFVQQSNGTFKFSALPRFAQIAPINAIVARDLDGDGKIDLACVGNQFGPEPTTGRFDGGLGVVLKGDGKGGFSAVTADASGFAVPGEARAMVSIGARGGKSPALVVARCDGPVLLFEPRSE